MKSHFFRLLFPLLFLLASCASAPVPEKPKESLLDLVENQNLEKIRQIFGLDTNVNSTDTYGNSALHIAAEKDLSDIAAVLLARGATVDLQNKSGKTPLLLAVENNSIKTIPLLVQYKASIFLKDAQGRSPLQTALDQNPTLIPLLLTKENVGSRDQDGNTPLHLAAQRGDESLVSTILNLGGDSSARNNAGQTPADLALQFPQSEKHAEIAWNLFQHGAPVPNSPDLEYFGKAGIANDVSLAFDLGNTPLHFAASRGQTGILRFLVQKGAVVDARDMAGNTPLHKALENTQLEAVKDLLRLGAKVNLQDFNNNTALHLALTSQDPLTEVRLLLENKADPNLKNNFGNTPLHMVIALNLTPELVNLLVSHGADVNARNKRGNTPLFEAVRDQRKPLVLALRAAGASIFAVNNFEQSPLSEAIHQGVDPLSWLVDKSNVNKQDDNGNTALHLAILAGNYPAAVQYLLDQGADPNVRNKKGQSPLHLAVLSQNAPLCSLLLKKGSNLFLVDNQSQSPLTLAFQAPVAFQEHFFTSDVLALTDSSQNTPLFYAIDSNSDAEVALLLSKGASVQVQNMTGDTPLHEATRQGSASLVDLLLKAGASVTATNKAGETAFQELIWVNPSRMERVGNALLSAGSDLDARNSEGRTVLDQAVRRGEQALCTYLLDKKANPNAPDNSGKTPVFEAVLNGQIDLLKLLLSRGGRPQDRDLSGTTPLHLAAARADARAIQILVQNGADPFAENKAGESPATVALRSGSDAWKAFFTPQNVNNQNNNGRTALHLAILSGAPPSAIQFLLSLGADPSLRDKDGKTALDLARSLGKTDLAQALTGSKTPSSANS
jgi:ankyrin repeat protein